jgi:Holliday junction DNA helicase RuvA
MIAFLRGQIRQKTPNQVIVDVGGVGYGALIPLSTYLRLGEENALCELHIYTHLTDSALSLYGFSTTEERELFLKLIGVSGIGPKLALNVLSGIGPDELEEAVRASDVARITLIPGIGKKLALRIALELQEKMDQKPRVLPTRASREREDVISALINLGFRRKEVENVVDQAIKSLKHDSGIERLLRESLRRLARV